MAGPSVLGSTAMRCWFFEAWGHRGTDAMIENSRPVPLCARLSSSVPLHRLEECCRPEWFLEECSRLGLAFEPFPVRRAVPTHDHHRRSRPDGLHGIDGSLGCTGERQVEEDHADIGMFLKGVHPFAPVGGFDDLDTARREHQAYQVPDIRLVIHDEDLSGMVGVGHPGPWWHRVI